MPDFRSLVVWDADDTLWPTQALYDEANSEFGRLAAAHGIDPRLAIKTVNDLDLVLSKTMGLSPARFPTSMRQGALQLFASEPTLSVLADQAQRIGESVFDKRSRPYDGIVETLGQLRREGVALAVLTRGQATVQQQRIDDSGLRAYFDHIAIVVEKKTSADFAAIAAALAVSPKDCFAIGNSYLSDIEPAKDAGLRTIFVPRVTWAYEDDLGDHRKADFICHSVDQVRGILTNVCARAQDLPTRGVA